MQPTPRNDINLRIEAGRESLPNSRKVDQIERTGIVVDDDVHIAIGPDVTASERAENIKRRDAGGLQRISVQVDQAANVIQRHDRIIDQQVQNEKGRVMPGLSIQSSS